MNAVRRSFWYSRRTLSLNMPTVPITPIRARTSSQRSCTPLTSSTPNRMATNTMNVPKSGWSRISAQTRPIAGSPTAPRRLPPGPEHRGQGDDGPDLGVLGRLDLVGAELEPGLGAVGGRPQRGQDECQGHHDGPEHHPGPGLEAAVVDHHGHHHDGQPQAEVE